MATIKDISESVLEGQNEYQRTTFDRCRGVFFGEGLIGGAYYLAGSVFFLYALPLIPPVGRVINRINWRGKVFLIGSAYTAGFWIYGEQKLIDCQRERSEDEFKSNRRFRF